MKLGTKIINFFKKKQPKRKAQYICIEGIDGTGKTTQLNLLVSYLEQKGFKVIKTKEPGTDRVPLTLKLREICLDNAYASMLKGYTREFILQSIRGIHLNNDIYQNLNNDTDFIIQDRGIVSGLAYGAAFGMDLEQLIKLNNIIVSEKGQEIGITTIYDVYDKVIFFTTKQAASFLENAINAKQEFETGDAIEAEGAEFMQKVLINFFKTKKILKDKLIIINVEDGTSGKLRPKEDILNDVIKVLNA